MKRGLICLSLTMGLLSTHVRAAEPVSYQVAADAVAEAVFKLPPSKDIADVEQELAAEMEAMKALNPGREKELEALAGEYFAATLPACEDGVRSFISYRFQPNLTDDVMQDVYAFLKTEEGTGFFQALSREGAAIPDDQATRTFLASYSGREFSRLMQNLNQPSGSFGRQCDLGQISALRKLVDHYGAMGIKFRPEVLEMLGD